MSDNIFTEGLPIAKRWKWKLVLITFFTLIINHNLPIFSSTLDYPYRQVVSLVLLASFVVFSLGSVVAESLVIGLCMFAIMSNVWDFSVLDTSSLRRQLLIGSFIVLGAALTFGKVSLINLVSIIKGQLGVFKK